MRIASDDRVQGLTDNDVVVLRQNVGYDDVHRTLANVKSTGKRMFLIDHKCVC
jgi:hypothetical protein